MPDERVGIVDQMRREWMDLMAGATKDFEPLVEPGASNCARIVGALSSQKAV